MTGAQALGGEASAPRPVNTLDLLKLAAVVLMVADHVGLYFAAGAWENPLRIAGRPVAVIFGFLIGYSGATRVPASWVALGLGITLLKDRLGDDEEDRALDILVTLALTRIVVPFFDRLHRWHPLLLVPMAVVLALLAEPTKQHLEYSTEVPLVALLGVAMRLSSGRLMDQLAIAATAVIGCAAMALIAIGHLEFSGWEIWAAAAVFAATFIVLSLFHVKPVRGAPAWLAPLLRFTGRNTLWIYAVHLALFQVAAWAIENWSE